MIRNVINYIFIFSISWPALFLLVGNIAIINKSFANEEFRNTSFRNCHSPTVEFIEAVKVVNQLQPIDRTQLIQSPFIVDSIMPTKYIAYLREHAIPMIESLTGLKEVTHDPDANYQNTIALYYSNDFYNQVLKHERYFHISNLIVGLKTGKDYSKFDEGFLNDAKVVSNFISSTDAGDEIQEYLVISTEDGRIIRSYFHVDDVDSLNGSRLKNGNKFRDLDNIWKYTILHELIYGVVRHVAMDIEYPSLLSSRKEYRELGFYHVIETGCFTPFDAAFLWYHFQL